MQTPIFRAFLLSAGIFSTTTTWTAACAPTSQDLYTTIRDYHFPLYAPKGEPLDEQLRLCQESTDVLKENLKQLKGEDATFYATLLKQTYGASENTSNDALMTAIKALMLTELKRLQQLAAAMKEQALAPEQTKQPVTEDIRKLRETISTLSASRAKKSNDFDNDDEASTTPQRTLTFKDGVKNTGNADDKMVAIACLEDLLRKVDFILFDSHRGGFCPCCGIVERIFEDEQHTCHIISKLPDKDLSGFDKNSNSLKIQLSKDSVGWLKTIQESKNFNAAEKDCAEIVASQFKELETAKSKINKDIATNLIQIAKYDWTCRRVQGTMDDVARSIVSHQ